MKYHNLLYLLRVDEGRQAPPLSTGPKYQEATKRTSRNAKAIATRFGNPIYPKKAKGNAWEISSILQCKVTLLAKYELGRVLRKRPRTANLISLWSSTSWWCPHSWSSNWQGCHQHSWQDDQWSEQRWSTTSTCVQKDVVPSLKKLVKHGFKKTNQQLLSTRKPSSDRRLEFFLSISRLVRRNSLNATGRCTQNTLLDAHNTHIFLVRTPQRIIRTFPVWAHHNGSRWNRVCVIHSVSRPSHSLMSLLNVPYRPFPRVLTEPPGTVIRTNKTLSFVPSFDLCDVVIEVLHSSKKPRKQWEFTVGKKRSMIQRREIEHAVKSTAHQPQH